ncbi:MAG TPA: SRPBCC family protein [Gemmatimonadaceae bacterium]|nr:SRPBCC family protein [Gemmatimonadaceae bacterium]
MTRTLGRATIARPVDHVFQYAASSGNWTKWYPITKSVTGVVDRPGKPGEQFVEHVRILGVPITFFWTTTENDYPRKYVFEGRSSVGGKAVITYTFAPEGAATAFTRELVYEQTNAVMKLIDALFLGRYVMRVSAEAVANLKAAIEAS